MVLGLITEVNFGRNLQGGYDLYCSRKIAITCIRLYITDFVHESIAAVVSIADFLSLAVGSTVVFVLFNCMPPWYWNVGQRWSCSNTASHAYSGLLSFEVEAAQTLLKPQPAPAYIPALNTKEAWPELCHPQSIYTGDSLWFSGGHARLRAVLSPCVLPQPTAQFVVLGEAVRLVWHTLHLIFTILTCNVATGFNGRACDAPRRPSRLRCQPSWDQVDALMRQALQPDEVQAPAAPVPRDAVQAVPAGALQQVPSRCMDALVTSLLQPAATSSNQQLQPRRSKRPWLRRTLLLCATAVSTCFAISRQVK
jgi:hypothetical protein